MSIRSSEVLRRFAASESGLTTVELSVLAGSVGLVLLIAISTLGFELSTKIHGIFAH